MKLSGAFLFVLLLVLAVTTTAAFLVRPNYQSRFCPLLIEPKRRSRLDGIAEACTQRRGLSCVLSAAKATKKDSVSADDIKSMLRDIPFAGGDPTFQMEKLDALADSGDLRLWASAWGSDDDDGDGILGNTFPVSSDMLEERTMYKITESALAFTQADMVERKAFADKEKKVDASNTADFTSQLDIIFEQQQEDDRICRHEAGHFLSGYICGLPIHSYSIYGTRTYVNFYGPSERELSAPELAALTIVGVSGSVAETLGGKEMAKNSTSDYEEIQGYFDRSTSSKLAEEEERQSLIRWASLMAYQFISENSDKFEELVKAFRQQKSVVECIAVLESRDERQQTSSCKQE